MYARIKGLVVVPILAGIFLAGTGFASAMTQAEALAQVLQLQTQLQAVLAQLAALQGQGAAQAPVATPVTTTPANVPSIATPSASGCISLTRPLGRGSEGSDVFKLQQFLAGGGYFLAAPTGFFGALTEKALKDFQSAQRIISYGTPESTGYGVTGPRTRSVVYNVSCGAAQVSTPPVTFTYQPNVTQQPVVQPVVQPQVQQPTSQSCTLSGVTIPSGTIYTVYTKSTVEPGESCSQYSSVRQCINGALTGNPLATYFACQTRQLGSCTLAGVTIASGGSRTFYSNARSAAGGTCASISQQRACTDGTLSGSGSYSYASCTEVPTGACVLGDKVITNGASVTFYSRDAAPAGGSCTSYAQSRKCTSTVLGGGSEYVYPTCSDSQSCTLDGLTVSNNASSTFYKSTHASYSQKCSAVSTQRKCTNGVLGGDATYQYSTCTVDMPSVSVAQSSVKQGQAVAASFANGPGSANDWLGLYAVGETNVANWKGKVFVNGLNTASIAKTDGNVTFTNTLSLPVGNYEIRFLSATSSALLASKAFSITSADSCTLDGATVAHGSTATFYSSRVAPYGGTCASLGQSRTCSAGVLSGSGTYQYASCAVGTPAVSTSKTSYKQGETIVANFSGGTASASDHIAIYVAGEAVKANWKDWNYVGGSRTLGAALVSGSVNFTSTAALVAGNYEVRFYRGSDGALLASNSFAITVGDPCTLDGITAAHNAAATFYSSRSASYAQGCAALSKSRTCVNGTFGGDTSYQFGSCTAGSPAVTLSATSYNQGTTIPVTFSNGPGAASDWIALYAAGVTGPTGWKDWVYVSGSRTLGQAKTDGSVSFTSTETLPVGNYEVRFLKGVTNALLASASLSILAGNSCTLDGVTVAHNASGTFYSSRTASYAVGCSSIALSRKCINGSLGGDAAYQYGSCTTGTPSITTDKSSYTPGEPIVFTFTNGSGSAKDRINLLNAAGTLIDWRYVDGTQAGVISKESGTVTFSNTLGYLGTYKGAFYKYTAGGNVLIATTTPFTISNATASIDEYSQLAASLAALEAALRALLK